MSWKDSYLIGQIRIHARSRSLALKAVGKPVATKRKSADAGDPTARARPRHQATVPASIRVRFCAVPSRVENAHRGVCKRLVRTEVREGHVQVRPRRRYPSVPPPHFRAVGSTYLHRRRAASPPILNLSPRLHPRQPSRATAATTGTGATTQEGAAPDGAGLVSRRGRQGRE